MCIRDRAYTGTGAYDGTAPAEDLRALMRLWPNYVQLVTTASTGIKTIEDLRGKRVGVGAANSGVDVYKRQVLLTVCMTLTLLPVSALAAGDVMTVKIDDGTPTTYQSLSLIHIWMPAVRFLPRGNRSPYRLHPFNMLPPSAPCGRGNF